MRERDRQRERERDRRISEEREGKDRTDINMFRGHRWSRFACFASSGQSLADLGTGCVCCTSAQILSVMALLRMLAGQAGSGNERFSFFRICVPLAAFLVH